MRTAIIQRVEWIVAAALTLTILFLLIARTTHAGALWRDECNSVQLAEMPTFGDVWRNSQFDSFPLFFPATVRTYIKLFGAGDRAMRYFGLSVGVIFLAVAWFNSRLTKSPPLLLLSLAGLNTGFLTWGTSLRAYGIGSAMIALSIGLTARLLHEGRARWVALTLLAYLISLHLLFHNAAIVLSLGLAAISCALMQRRRKLAVTIIALGFICALSYLPYWTNYSLTRWQPLIAYDLGLGKLWHEFMTACGEPARIMPWLWQALIAAGVICTIVRTFQREKGRPEQTRYLDFGLLFVTIATFSYFLFLRVLSLKTEAWYYLPLVCGLAAALDLIALELSRSYAWRISRLAFAVLALALLPLSSWSKVTERQTNVDEVARKLEQVSSAQDLIIINPWYFGVSFRRYYHGQAAWTTLPRIDNLETHRYDLLKAQMISPDPLQDVRDQVERILTSGSKVWIVGRINMPQDPQQPLRLAPAPNSEFGWKSSGYLQAWSEQMTAFMALHSQQTQPAFPASENVNELENLPVWMAEGWKN